MCGCKGAREHMDVGVRGLVGCVGVRGGGCEGMGLARGDMDVGVGMLQCERGSVRAREECACECVCV